MQYRLTSFAAFAIALSAMLSACGGAGSSANSAGIGSSLGGGASSIDFNLREAEKNSFLDNRLQDFTVSGVDKVIGNFSGSGTITPGQILTTSFEGSSSFSRVYTLAGQVQSGFQQYSLQSVESFYVNSAYEKIGTTTDGEYSVWDSVSSLPIAAKTGASGPMPSHRIFSDSTKSTLLETVSYNYRLEGDTEGNNSIAYLRIMGTGKNAAGAVTSTRETLIRVTPEGGQDPLWFTYSYVDGSYSTYQFSYR
jgi:hypothetical protein